MKKEPKRSNLELGKLKFSTDSDWVAIVWTLAVIAVVALGATQLF